MRTKNSMVAFGSAFRGYRKADVNDYIERKAAEFRRMKEELKADCKRLEETADELRAENGRLADLLRESDTLVTEQKQEIDTLGERLEVSNEAFTLLKEEVELLTERVLALQKTKTSAAPDKSAPEREPLNEKPKAEPQKNPAEEKDDEISLSGALKVIKDKILKFLK